MFTDGCMGLLTDACVPRKPSNWRGTSEFSAGQTGLISLMSRGVVQEISKWTDVFLLC